MVAFSIDPEFTVIIDQLLGFEKRKIVVFFPFIPKERRIKPVKSLSLVAGVEHKCIKVSFSIDEDNFLPIGIKTEITTIVNQRAYAVEYVRIAEIVELNTFGKNILTKYTVSAMYRLANMAMSIFALKRRLPFIGKYDNDSLFICKNFQNYNKHVWTAPLRRETDKINIINLGHFLETGETLYDEDFLEDYIQQKKGSFYTLEKLQADAKKSKQVKSEILVVDKKTEGKQNKKFSKKKKEETHRRHHGRR
jgi:hypothetical protein